MIAGPSSLGLPYPYKGGGDKAGLWQTWGLGLGPSCGCIPAPGSVDKMNLGQQGAGLEPGPAWCGRQVEKC